MPFVQISLRAGKSALYRRAIGDSVHRALIETLGIPPEDHFQLIAEHDCDNVVYDRGYLGIARTDDIVFVVIKLGSGRTPAQKRVLYARIATLLAEAPGVRPQDVFITLFETAAENWSFGNGVAQYADKHPSWLLPPEPERRSSPL